MVTLPAPGEQRPGSTKTLLTARSGSVLKRTVLPNGARIVTEARPGTRSVSAGVWVGVGSRDETPTMAGATHFLEHLLFKGTKTRSAWDISSSIDAVGGDLNAYTTKELTCYHAKVLDGDLPLAIDVLVDMVTQSLVTPEDVEAERTVVLEEMAMYADDPTDVAHEQFRQLSLAGSPLAKPVLGTNESIAGMPRSVVWRHYRKWYQPEHLVITAAGNVNHAKLVRQVKRLLPDTEGVPAAARSAKARRGKPVWNGGQVLTVRPTEQANVFLGYPGVDRTDDRRWALGVLMTVLGGGMSSRLFQEVREKRGLAYSVHAFRSAYTDAGSVAVYAGCSPEKADEVVSVVREELAAVVRSGLTRDEVERGKGQLRGGTVMDLEDVASRMGRLGDAEIISGQIMPVDEVLANIEAVTVEQVHEIAREVFSKPEALSVVGPFGAGRSF